MTKAELEKENARLKKLLSQCMERQVNPPVFISDDARAVVSKAVELAHGCYTRIFWRLCWYRSFEL